MPDLKPEGQRQVMAFDFGLRRIGVAVGQEMLGTASPVTMIGARDGIPRWDEVEALIADWKPDFFVVGLPLNMDGSESEMCRRARKFARRLHGMYHRDYAMMDERLTSFAAKSAIVEREGGRDFGVKGVDDLAAVLILEGWFLQQRDQQPKIPTP